MNIHLPETVLAGRPSILQLNNGVKARLPFANEEYEARLTALRDTMEQLGLQACVLTSMHCIAYYSGFLYCSFGRPYACVVTGKSCTTVSANIDAGQPWRRCYGDNIVYTDWKRDNYLQGILGLISGSGVADEYVEGNGKGCIGVEYDHLSCEMFTKMQAALNCNLIDIAPHAMAQRMIKSESEIALIREGARIADIGGWAIRDVICEGASELEIAQAGRLAMETEIATAFPQSEIRDSWVWFQSGLNTDGAHNPLTTRRLEQGDILSLNTFPMINGYYTALERTLFLGEPDAQSLRIWEANVAVHRRGLELLKPGAVCREIVAELNELCAAQGLLEYRTFGYGHSFGILSHYYGREAGLELREDIDTILQPGMVVSMEPMLMIPDGQPGAGGYREHDIVVIGQDGGENITTFPFGPENNIVC